MPRNSHPRNARLLSLWLSVAFSVAMLLGNSIEVSALRTRTHTRTTQKLTATISVTVTSSESNMGPTESFTSSFTTFRTGSRSGPSASETLTDSATMSTTLSSMPSVSVQTLTLSQLTFSLGASETKSGTLTVTTTRTVTPSMSTSRFSPTDTLLIITPTRTHKPSLSDKITLSTSPSSVASDTHSESLSGMPSPTSTASPSLQAKSQSRSPSTSISDTRDLTPTTTPTSTTSDSPTPSARRSVSTSHSFGSLGHSKSVSGTGSIPTLSTVASGTFSASGTMSISKSASLSRSFSSETSVSHASPSDSMSSSLQTSFSATPSRLTKTYFKRTRSQTVSAPLSMTATRTSVRSSSLSYSAPTPTISESSSITESQMRSASGVSTSASHSPSSSALPSATGSQSPSPSVSLSYVASSTILSQTQTDSATGSPSSSMSNVKSASRSRSASSSKTLTFLAASTSDTETITLSKSASSSPSVTFDASATAKSGSATFSASTTRDASSSYSLSVTMTASLNVTQTQRLTPSLPSISRSPTVATSLSSTASITPTATTTETASTSPTSRRSTSYSQSGSIHSPTTAASATRSMTLSRTPSMSTVPTKSAVTPSVSFSTTTTVSAARITSSKTTSSSRTVSLGGASTSRTLSRSPSVSLEPTMTRALLQTHTASLSTVVSKATRSMTTPKSKSISHSGSSQRSTSPTSSRTPTVSTQPTISVSLTVPQTPSVSPSLEPSLSRSRSGSLSPTSSESPSIKPSSSRTTTVSKSVSLGRSASRSPSKSATEQVSYSPSSTPSLSRTASVKPSMSRTASDSVSRLSYSPPSSRTVSYSSSISVTVSQTVSRTPSLSDSADSMSPQLTRHSLSVTLTATHLSATQPASGSNSPTSPRSQSLSKVTRGSRSLTSLSWSRGSLTGTLSDTSTRSQTTDVSASWTSSPSAQIRSATRTVTVSRSSTPSRTLPTQQFTATLTQIPSPTRTLVASKSNTTTTSFTSMQTQSVKSSSPTFSQLRVTMSRSVSMSKTASPSITGQWNSATKTASKFRTRTRVGSASISMGHTATKSSSGSVSYQKSTSRTPSQTWSISSSETPTPSQQLSLSLTVALLPSATQIPSDSRTVSKQFVTGTATRTDSMSDSASFTQMRSLTESVTVSAEMASFSDTVTRTAPTPSSSLVFSATVNRVSRTGTLRSSRTSSLPLSATSTLRPTRSKQPTFTRNREMSPTATHVPNGHNSTTLSHLATMTRTVSRSLTFPPASTSRTSSLSPSLTDFRRSVSLTLIRTITTRLSPTRSASPMASTSKSISARFQSRSTTVTITPSMYATVSLRLPLTITVAPSDTVTNSESERGSRSKSRSRVFQSVTRLTSRTRTELSSLSVALSRTEATLSKSPSVSSDDASTTITSTATNSQSTTFSLSSSGTGPLTVTSTVNETRTTTVSSGRSQSKSASHGSKTPTAPSSRTTSWSTTMIPTTTPNITRSASVAEQTSTATDTVTVTTSSSRANVSTTRSKRTASMEITKTFSVSTSGATVASSSTISQTSTFTQGAPSSSTTATVTLSISPGFQSSSSSNSQTISSSHWSATNDATKTPTITPPPTPTRSVTPSLSQSARSLSKSTSATTGSSQTLYRRSRSPTPLPSQTVSRTPSPSESPSPSQQPKSGSVTLTLTLSRSPSRGSSTASTSQQGTATLTSQKITVSRTIRITLTHSPPLTASHSSRRTNSFSVTGSVASFTLRMSSTESRSVTLTETETVSETDSVTAPWHSKTVTESPTATLNFISANTVFSTVPKSPLYQYTANRVLMMSFAGAPLNVSGDAARLVLSTDSCSNPSAAYFIIPLVSRSRTPNVHNWTATPRVSGTFSICYFSTTSGVWQQIIRPVATIQIAAAVSLSKPLIVQSNMLSLAVFTATIFGAAQTTSDVPFLVPYGQACTYSPRSSEGSVLSWDSANYTVTFRFVGITVAPGDFSVCYIGFPYDTTKPLLVSGSRRIRLVGAITGVTPLSLAQDYQVGRTIQFNIRGLGLSVRDAFFLSNISNTSQSPCAKPYSTASSRISWGSIQRVTTSAASWYNLASYVVAFPLQVPYNLTICFRSNFSSSFRYIQPLDRLVAPVLPTARVPNISLSQAGATTTYWSTSSTIVQTFYGSFLDSTYDRAWLYWNTTDCDNAVAVTRIMPFSSPLLPSGAGIASYAVALSPVFAAITTASLFMLPTVAAICYQSNVSLILNTGTVRIGATFWNATDPDTLSLFRDGVESLRTVSIFIADDGVAPTLASTRIYLLAGSSSTCLLSPPLNAVLPLSKSGPSVTFVMGTRGVWNLCAASAMTGNVQQASFVVLPRFDMKFVSSAGAILPPDTAIEVPLMVSTVITLTGGVNFIDSISPDIFRPCDTSLASSLWSVTPLTSSTAYVTVRAVFQQLSWCVTMGLHPATIVAVNGTMTVPPAVVQATVSPTIRFAGTDATMVLVGYGLTANDSIFSCTTSSALNGSLVTLLDAGTLNVIALNATVNMTRLVQATWTFRSSTAGSFPLCVVYGLESGTSRSLTVVSSTTSPAAVSLTFDAAVTGFSPLTVTAAQNTNVTLQGPGADVWVTVLYLEAAATCTQTITPTNVVYLSKQSGPVWSLLVNNVRGAFPLCYRSYSTYVHTAGVVTVIGAVNRFISTQDGVSGSAQTGTRYAGYPLSVTVMGASLMPSSDTFFWVRSSLSCSSTATTTNGDVVTMTLTSSANSGTLLVSNVTFSATFPYSGIFRLCYRLGSDISFSTLLSPVLSTVSSFQVSANSVALVGPAAAASPFVQFLFAPSLTANPVVLTAYASYATSKSLALAYTPYGTSWVAARLITSGGATMLSINQTVTYSSTSQNISLCTNVPQTLANSDILYQLAMSIIVLYNFDALDCYSRIPTDYLLGPTLLIQEVLRLAAASDASLVTDPQTLMTLTSKVSLKTPLSTSKSTTLLQSLLTTSASTLAAGDSTITESLLLSHVDMVSNIVAAAAADPTSVSQSTVVACVNRLQLVGEKFCSTGLASSASTVQVTVSSLALSVVSPTAGTSAISIATGNVSTVIITPSDASVALGCVMSVASSSNFIPVATSTASYRSLAELDTASSATVSSFNIPLMNVAFPGSGSSSPLSQLKTVQFSFAHGVDTSNAPLGFTVAATVYRFAPDSSATTGSWTLDPYASVTVDATKVYIALDLVKNPVSTTTSPRSYVYVSGTYAVSPATPPAPGDETDVSLGAYVITIVVLHFIAIGAGAKWHRGKGLRNKLSNRNAPTADPDVAATDREASVKVGSAAGDHRAEDLSDDVQRGGVAHWTDLHRHTSIFRPQRGPSTTRKIIVATSHLFACSIFALQVLRSAAKQRTLADDILSGFITAVIATPFAVPVRVMLSGQSRDMASVIGAVAAMVSAVIAIFASTAAVEAIVTAAVGLPMALIVWLAFARHCSLDDEAARSASRVKQRVHLVLGTLFHVTIVCVMVVFGLVVAFVDGTPAEWRTRGSYFIVVAAAMLFDSVIFEPLKAVVLLALHRRSLRVASAFAAKEEATLRGKLRVVASAPTATTSNTDLNRRSFTPGRAPVTRPRLEAIWKDPSTIDPYGDGGVAFNDDDVPSIEEVDEDVIGGHDDGFEPVFDDRDAYHQPSTGPFGGDDLKGEAPDRRRRPSRRRSTRDFHRDRRSSTGPFDLEEVDFEVLAENDASQHSTAASQPDIEDVFDKAPAPANTRPALVFENVRDTAPTPFSHPVRSASRLSRLSVVSSTAAGDDWEAVDSPTSFVSERRSSMRHFASRDSGGENPEPELSEVDDDYLEQATRSFDAVDE